MLRGAERACVGQVGAEPPRSVGFVCFIESDSVGLVEKDWFEHFFKIMHRLKSSPVSEFTVRELYLPKPIFVRSR